MSARRSRPGNPKAATKAFGGAKTSIADTPPIVLDENHEPTAWLRQAAATRLAAVERQIQAQANLTVMTPLVRDAVPGSREDRTCDRCGTYTPPGGLFYPCIYRAQHRLIRRSEIAMFFGYCAACADLESPRITEGVAS